MAGVVWLAGRESVALTVFLTVELSECTGRILVLSEPVRTLTEDSESVARSPDASRDDVLD